VNQKQIAEGDVVSLPSLVAQDGSVGAAVLAKDSAFQALVLRVTPTKPIAEHAVDGPIVVQCLQGTVDFSIEGAARKMGAGDWMYVAGGKPHALSASEDATLLVIRVLAD
jgi:quercetin dioxygenase-like cupin family protein